MVPLRQRKRFVTFLKKRIKLNCISGRRLVQRNVLNENHVSHAPKPKYIIHDLAIVWASDSPLSSFSQEYCFTMLIPLTTGRIVWWFNVFLFSVSGGKKSGKILEPFRQNISVRLFRVVSFPSLRFSRDMLDDTIWARKTFLQDFSMIVSQLFWLNSFF